MGGVKLVSCTVFHSKKTEKEKKRFRNVCRLTEKASWAVKRAHRGKSKPFSWCNKITHPLSLYLSLSLSLSIFISLSLFIYLYLSLSISIFLSYCIFLFVSLSLCLFETQNKYVFLNFLKK
jgi:hypothetical protein